MTNINPLYILENKIFNKEISGINERIKDIPRIYKEKFNSFKNGPTFWDLYKINSWRNGANLEATIDKAKILNKKKLSDSLKKGKFKILKKIR